MTSHEKLVHPCDNKYPKTFTDRNLKLFESTYGILKDYVKIIHENLVDVTWSTTDSKAYMDVFCIKKANM